jgi:hypothetical protein
MRVSHSMKLGLSAVVAALLSACGGGGGLPDAAPSPVVAQVAEGPLSTGVGRSFVIKGSATSQPNAMESMGWSVTKLTAGAPDLTLSNADCANGTRAGNTVNDITRSVWACDALVSAPTSLSVDSTYRLTFTGTDESGNSATDFHDVVVIAGGGGPGSSPPVATTQASVAVTSGDDVGLSCFGSGGALSGGSDYVYSWVVKSNPGGLALMLDPVGSGQLNFKAPAVRASTSITLQCRVQDDALAMGTADTVVTISPNGTVAAIASAGAAQTVAQGVTVQLDASTSSAPGGAALYFLWEQIEGPAVALPDSTAVRPTFVAPAVLETTRLTFRVTAMVTAPANPAAAAPSETATVSVYVTPEQPLSLSISAATAVQSGTAVSLQVSASPAGGSLYYAWSQVSGPTVTIGGASTSTASFISPDVVGSYVDSLFMVSVSRKPLNVAQPGEIFTADVVVRTTP